MKTRLLIIILLFAVIYTAKSQTPQSFNYQCVVRNSLGQIAVNKLVSFKISILKGSALGNTVYAETHNKATNGFGLATLEIGDGTVISGNFTNINWGADIYFLNTEFDYNGGSNYEFMGTSQLLSVPYAIYAEKAGNAEDDHDNDSLNEIQTINKTDSIVTLSKNGGSFIDSDNQTIAIVGNQLQISNGNSVTLSGTIDLDADPTNELQNLNLNNDTLSISQGNSVIFPHDNDRDSTNEIQYLSKHADTLFLSKANYVIIPKDNDTSSTNEIQNLSFSNDTLYISNGNSVFIQHVNDYAIYEEQKGSGSSASNLTLGWNIRTLNTTVDSSGLSVVRNGDTIIMVSGKYRITACASALNVSHKIRFRNITDNITMLLGTSSYINPSTSTVNLSFIDGVINISATKSFQLQHYVIGNSIGGLPAYSGENEVYARLYIEKIK